MNGQPNTKPSSITHKLKYGKSIYSPAVCELNISTAEYHPYKIKWRGKIY